MLVDHIKTGGSIKKDRDGRIVHEWHELSINSTLSLWFNRKNGIHRPSGEDQASGEQNRGEYLSRKIPLDGPWNSSARIIMIGVGRPRQLVFPDSKDSHQVWMIGNHCQLTSQYEPNLWRGTMHGEGRVTRRSIKPKLSVDLSLKAWSENCQDDTYVCGV